MTYYNLRATGKNVKIYDDGVLLTEAAGSIDFTGTGVTGTTIGDAVTEFIPLGGGTSGVMVNGEVPTGDIDGNNTIFTLAHTPANSLKVYLGGARQKENEDYTVVGAVITFITAPMTGSILICDYNY